jgi:hypothetical protein
MRAKLLICFSLIILLGLNVINSWAQQLPASVTLGKRTPDGRYNFLKFKTPVSGQRPVDPSAASIKLMLGLGVKHNLVPDDRANNSLSKQSSRSSHTRYQQYFNGLKVEFAVLTTHKANNNLEALTGEYFTIPENFSVTPTLSEAPRCVTWVAVYTAGRINQFQIRVFLLNQKANYLFVAIIYMQTNHPTKRL